MDYSEFVGGEDESSHVRMDGEDPCVQRLAAMESGVADENIATQLTDADTDSSHCSISPHHTTKRMMDGAAGQCVIKETSMSTIQAPSAGSDDENVLDKGSQVPVLNSQANETNTRTSKAACQVIHNSMENSQDDLCTSNLGAHTGELRDSIRGSSHISNIDNKLGIDSENPPSLIESSVLLDESVVEYSCENNENVNELRDHENDMQHLEKEDKRTVVDADMYEHSTFLDENKIITDRERGHECAYEGNLRPDDNASDDAKLKLSENCLSESPVQSDIKASVDISRGNSEDRDSSDITESVGFQSRTNSQDSGGGSGVTSGPMSTSDSGGTSGFDRVGSSDSADSSESGGTYLGEEGCKMRKGSGMLLSEIETLMCSRAANPHSQDSADFEVSTLDFSSTPKHNLMKMLSGLLDECDALKNEKARLEGEVARLEADSSSHVHSAQIEALEKSLAQAEADACSWKEAVREAEQKHIAEMVWVREDLTGRVERLTNQYQAANKDKEAMVIKYATAEREVIQVKRQKEAVEKKLRDLEREKEQLISKNKMLISERARICQTLDTKVQRNNWYQREVDRLKEEVNNREVKIKWAQTKLKTEMDAHQECQSKLDRALTKILRHEAELKEVKEKAEELVRTTLDDQNSRANVLDMRLKEEKARVILERQVNEDRGSAFSRVSTELETLKAKHLVLEEEATTLRSRVASLECEREESEKLFGSLRTEVTSARQEASQLSLQLANTSHLQQQLNREREASVAATREVEQLQAVQMEMEVELDACRTKEAELLTFTQKLSDKNVDIQSQFSALQSKNQLVEVEKGEAVAELDEAKKQLTHLKAELAHLRQSHTSQVSELQCEVSKRSEEAARLNIRVLDLESEIQVLNRKHANALKDLSREMQKLRRRVEQQENGGGGECVGGAEGSGRSSQVATPHDTLTQPSPASSNTSLNTLEYTQPTHNGTHPSQQDGMVEMVVPQQVLVERIVKLQRAAAKRAEKIEFLEEHVAQLVVELKKKSRIIHHYIMKEEAGALSSSASDLSKAEVVRHGGIMASVYGSTPRDATMTLELSLEINAKLQAVLEDTLLKNITLKENLNTLGDEIAKISRQNQQLGGQK